MTESEPDSELRAMAQHLFGDDRQEPGIGLSQPTTKSTNTVPAEGTNPAPVLLDDDAYTRDMARRLFDPAYASYQQELPQ